jgi:hypothetical protein
MNSLQNEPDEAASIEELLGGSTTQHFLPTDRDFKPWHKPRKQWIREEQWAKHCLKLMEDHLAEGQEFTYLSLPGPDLLDVRFLSQTCLSANRNLRFLGFNNPSDESSADKISLTKGVAEICQSDHVSNFSSVVPDRLENLADGKSVANRTLAEFGSLDAINIDLCNSMLGHVPLSKQATYYDALHALFEHQKNKRTKPFLLFLTTKTDRPALKESAVALLASAVKKNLSNPDFKDKLSKDFKVDAYEVNNLIDTKKLSLGWSNRKVSKFVSVALIKWMLGLLWDGQPSWYINILDGCEYQVHTERDMLSICCLCVPMRKVADDRARLSRHNQPDQSASISERSLAMDVLDKVISMFDLDERLEADTTAFDDLVGRAAKLMETAGYSGEKYKSHFGLR